MCQLESDQEIVGVSVSLAMGAQERFPKRGDACLICLVYDELVGIRAAIGPYRHRLAAPDEFGSTHAEALPPPGHGLGHAASGRAVPALHRLDAPSVANRAFSERYRL